MARNKRRRPAEPDRAKTRAHIEPNPRSQRRAEQKRRDRRRKFIRRRIILSLVFVGLLVFAINKISNALNTYQVMGYPSFRDEALEAIGDEVFVSPSEGRSLSTAEKVTDFDNFYKIIEKNYAVDELNREDYEGFLSRYDAYRRKVASTKTDQDYFNTLNQYLEELDDTRTFILDKETYESLFNYYRNQSSSKNKEVLENPQAVNRYKRLIQGQTDKKLSMDLGIEAGNILRISLEDFRPDEFDKDLNTIRNTLLSNPMMTTFIIDLRNNNSIDYVYRNKLLEIILPANYSESHIVFYRGKEFAKTLAAIKEIEGGPYQSAFVKNDAGKYSGELSSIRTRDYSYYDELNLNINKNQDYSNRKIYVLTNANTANEAIKFAEIVQKNGGTIVKNALEVGPTYRDVIYNAPSDLAILEHSGLVLSINSAYSKNEENKYLEYDQKINSKDPISTILNMIN